MAKVSSYWKHLNLIATNLIHFDLLEEYLNLRIESFYFSTLRPFFNAPYRRPVSSISWILFCNFSLTPFAFKSRFGQSESFAKFLLQKNAKIHFWRFPLKETFICYTRWNISTGWRKSWSVCPWSGHDCHPLFWWNCGPAHVRWPRWTARLWRIFDARARSSHRAKPAHGPICQHSIQEGALFQTGQGNASAAERLLRQRFRISSFTLDGGGGVHDAARMRTWRNR